MGGGAGDRTVAGLAVLYTFVAFAATGESRAFSVSLFLLLIRQEERHRCIWLRVVLKRRNKTSAPTSSPLEDGLALRWLAGL